jgi:hypothetical protein
MAHGDSREGKWRGNWRMEWVTSNLHTTSEHGVSSITTADAHTLAASSRLNWRPHRFKWTRPFRRKTKSGFCACAITCQTQSTLDTPCSEIVWRVLIPTPFASFPFTSPPCVTVCHHISNAVYAGYTMFRDSVKSTDTHSIRQFPLHFTSLRHRLPSHFNWTLQTFTDINQNACYEVNIRCPKRNYIVINR